MINNTVLVGRITKDPELRYTSSNIAFVKFTIAVNRKFAESNGEREADFISCMVWRKQAENMAKFIKKGSLIGLEGRIETGSYDDKDNIRRYTTTIVCDSVTFLEPKGSQQGETPTQKYSGPYDNKNRKDIPTIDVVEDDLPF